MCVLTMCLLVASAKSVGQTVIAASGCSSAALCDLTTGKLAGSNDWVGLRDKTLRGICHHAPVPVAMHMCGPWGIDTL